MSPKQSTCLKISRRSGQMTVLAFARVKSVKADWLSLLLEFQARGLEA